MTWRASKMIWEKGGPRWVDMTLEERVAYIRAWSGAVAPLVVALEEHHRRMARKCEGT